jgi:hypothetical protein
MKFLFTICFLLFAFASQAQVYPIAFYNMENLFDPADDPNTDDDEFTPNGKSKYTQEVYAEKLSNMAYVLQRIGTDKNANGAVLIGVAEIENDKVLRDLVNDKSIRNRKYKYLWFNSTDPRGIDVALLYNPAQFRVLQSKPLHFEGARDALYVTGILGGDTIHVLVNHWPSRRDGKDETEERRLEIAAINRKQIDEIRRKNPAANIILMGDFNDNPEDKSVYEVLGARSDANSEKNTLYNPLAAVHTPQKGSLVYKKHWDLFDQIILSASLVKHKGLHYDSSEIYDRPFLRQETGKFKNYPFRSYRGTFWNHGYSDHFPVVVYLKK